MRKTPSEPRSDTESTGIPLSFYEHHPDWDQNVFLQPGKCTIIPY